MSFSKAVFVAAFAAVSLTFAVSDAGARIGVVMLHGNLSDGLQFSNMVGLFEQANFGLQTPDMCWSDLRQYDKPPLDCMSDVDKAVARLKADGYDQIVIAGHSMGGINTELYAANHNGLAGVILFAPVESHVGQATDATVAFALNLVAQGQGDTRVQFPSVGGNNPIKSVPKVWLTYFGPDSVLDDKTLLPRISAPVFWAAGTDDPGQKNAADRFKLAPSTPLNRLVVVKADHFATPDVATPDMMAWLNDLQATLDKTKQTN
jgi:pimeloyl-ACP methyl ester carboxylesterase